MRDANSQSNENKHQDKNKEKQALEFIQTGELKEAEVIYRELISKGSKNHVVYVNLAAICHMRGNKAEIIDLLKSALQIKPNISGAHNNLGVALKGQGNLNAAISSFQKAIELTPNNPEPHYNLGKALQEKGDFTAAIASYKQALQLKPCYPEAYNNLGNTLQKQGDLIAAIKSYQQALTLKHDDPSTHYNLGIAQAEKGDLIDAISSYREAIKFRSDYPDAHKNLGIALLLNGDYQEGWLEYEYRFKKLKNPILPHSNPQIQKWQGDNLDSNERLLVVSEQGLGDTIQFMRYIPYLKQLGIDIDFCAQTKLHELIKASGIISKPLTPKQGNLVKEGKWIPLLSIPRLLNVTPKNPIVIDPYIRSSNNLTHQWRDILSTEQKRIIGINWQGNPKAESMNLKGRSIPLEEFSTIAKNKGCKLLSLQKGFGSEQLDRCSFKDQFVRCQNQVDETWDFLETVAIIANCDLVITCDTSIAHLAGGMGKKVWCLLHNVPDWRWGMSGEKTFWYPSIKLFRQQEKNNWKEVMERVSIELLSF